MLTRNDSLKTTNNCYLNANRVEYIVVHYTALLVNIRNFCLNQMNNEPNGTAHDFVSDTEWYQSIDPKHGAYSVGDDNGYGRFPNGINNCNSLNIEMIAAPYTLPSDKTIENTAEIVAYYMKIYNVPIEKVKRHYDASYKECPYGMHGNNNAKWNEFIEKVKGYYNGDNKFREEDFGMILFSENWYLKKNSDVAKVVNSGKMTALEHYIKYGKAEGRQPLPPIPAGYKEGDYLELNPDVKGAIDKGSFSSGIHHYLTYAFCENRKICKDDNAEAIKKRVEELEIKLEQIKNIIG